MIYFEQISETETGRDVYREASGIGQTAKPDGVPRLKRPEAVLPIARKPFEVAA